MSAKPKTIDEYLAAVRDEQRPALERLRETIRRMERGRSAPAKPVRCEG